MLGASFARLNAEFGFSLALGKPLDFDRFAERAAADREQLRPVPRPDAGAAPGPAEVHGAVPAHADLQAARRVREREQRARALEQGRLGAGRLPVARAPQGVQAAQRDAREGADRGRRARDAHRRDRDAGPAPAAVPGARRPSWPRRFASTPSRRRSPPTPRWSTLDLPLFDDAVPVEEMEQRQA